MSAPALFAAQPQAESNRAESTWADPIEEIRLRTWARHNFVPAAERSAEWPLVVLDEMARVDREA